MNRKTRQKDANGASQIIEHHPLCLGFDPDVTDLHPFLKKQFSSIPVESFLVRWYQSATSQLDMNQMPIKFQSAFFEQFGASGMAALRDIMLDAKRRQSFVILDAKRGDISSTMTAYGRAAFDQYHADALTILPWMGTDSLEALIPWLKQGKRVYIVWISSNKSGQELQMQPSSATNRPFATIIFEQFAAFARKNSVSHQVGWVLGATSLSPDFIEQLPKEPLHLLLPGIGAQGATFDNNTKNLLLRHPTSLFPISRGLLRVDQKQKIASWDDYGLIVAQNWQFFLTSWAKSCASP